MDYKQKNILEQSLSNIIDTTWHHSWHWPKDKYGYLTLDGWKKALDNAREERGNCEGRAAKLSRVIEEIVEMLREENTE